MSKGLHRLIWGLIGGLVLLLIPAGNLRAAQIEKRSYPLSGFRGLSISAAVDVILSQEDNFHVRGEFYLEGLARELQVVVKRGTLLIEAPSEIREAIAQYRREHGGSAPATLYVSMPVVDLLASEGGGKLTVQTNLRGKGSLHIEQSGSGGISLMGVEREGSILLSQSGSGAITAQKLNGSSARLDQSGSGAIRIGNIVLNSDLMASQSSSGSVQIDNGTAKTCSADQSGSGAIIVGKLQAVDKCCFDCSGSGSTRIKVLKSPAATVENSGSGSTVIAGGEVQELTLSSGGSGICDALGLRAQVVHASNSGSGLVKVYAERELHAKSGSVLYKGNAQVTSRGARVRQL